MIRLITLAIVHYFFGIFTAVCRHQMGFTAHTEKDSLECTIRDTAGGARGRQEKASRILTFSGFIKYDIFYDTRQTVNAREALVTLYPANTFLDASQRDINARSGMNMLGIHSRLRSEIRGPSFFSAKSTGLVEVDFYGNENKHFSDLNGVRLFNAYMKLNWPTTELVIGQDWHPMSIQGFFPGVIAFSAGAPFHPMSRNPQIRVRQSFGNASLLGAALFQRDFTGTGPDGPGSHYLRNSGIPNIHLQALHGNDSLIVSAGIGVDYKKIVPRLFYTNTQGTIFKSGQSLSSISLTGFISIRSKMFSLKTQGVFAQNAYDLLLLGGYAESHYTDDNNVEAKYRNLNTASGWIDIQSNRRVFNFGVFCGYTKNLGAGNKTDGAFYARGADINSIYRIAPRLIYASGAVGVSLEGEYTTASYGVQNGNGKGKVANPVPVTNLRTLLSVKYSF